MNLYVRITGPSREITGGDIEISKKINDSEKLLNYLFEKYPELKRYSIKISVNNVFVTVKTKLSENSETFIFSPYAGG